MCGHAVHDIGHDQGLRAAGQGCVDCAAVLLGCGRPCSAASWLQDQAGGAVMPACMSSSSPHMGAKSEMWAGLGLENLLKLSACQEHVQHAA